MMLGFVLARNGVNPEKERRQNNFLVIGFIDNWSLARLYNKNYKFYI